MTHALRDLKQLKENHKIYVALADFMQVWCVVVAYLYCSISDWFKVFLVVRHGTAVTL
jgi:hypothetical protein